MIRQYGCLELACINNDEKSEEVADCCRDELLVTMQRFLGAVKTLLDAFMTRQQSSQSRVRLEQQLAYLTDAQSADDTHPVHTLVNRSVNSLMIAAA